LETSRCCTRKLSSKLYFVDSSGIPVRWSLDQIEPFSQSGEEVELYIAWSNGIIEKLSHGSDRYEVCPLNDTHYGVIKHVAYPF
jgi:hypothetical protein